MSIVFVTSALRSVVTQRAQGRCEYCLLSADDALLPHEPDHIIARQHGGLTVSENLALACFDCNRFKGPNIASVDPATGLIVPLFNPRGDVWAEHFWLDAAKILALTPAARSTAALLKFNAPGRIKLREALHQTGRYSR